MTRPYKITQFDESVAALASRFSIAHPEIIYDLNSDVFETGGDVYLAFEPSLVGQVLQLPDDPDKVLFDWEPYTAKQGETLEAVCVKKNKDRRIDPSRKGKDIPSPPLLQPQYLLDLYENANVRAGHGPDSGKVKLAQHETVMIPFPKSRAGKKPVAATPNGKTKVDVHPSWIDEINNWVRSLQERTRKFVASMVTLRHQKELGLREVQILQAAKAVLTLEIEKPADGPSQVGKDIAAMKSFAHILDDLINTAVDEMFVNVCKHTHPKLLKDTEALGESIIKDLHGDDLKRLTKTLAKVADRYPTTTNELSFALSYAYLSLADSFLAEKIRPDIEAVARFLAGLKKVKVDGLMSVDPKLAQAVQAIPPAGSPMDPLSNMVSLLQVMGSSVGNLPGPSTLAVAMVRLKAMINGSRQILEKQSNVAWTLSIEEQAVFVAMSVNSMAASEAEAADLIIIVGKLRVATLTRTPINPESFQWGYIKQFLKKIDDEAGGPVMSSPKWVAGMSAFNLLIAGLAAYDMWETKDVNLAGIASIGFGVGAGISGGMKMLKIVGAEGLGRAVAFAGVIYGAVQTYRSWSDGDKVGAGLNLMSTVGSALLFASCFAGPFGPFLAVAGGGLIVISTIAAVVRDLMHSSTSRWWEGMEKVFEDGAVYKAIQGKAPGLAAKVQSLKAGIGRTTFLLIDALQSETLGKFVDKDSMPMLLATNDVPFEMPLGI